MYCCTRKEKLKCKARLVAIDQQDKIVLRNMIHNHGPTYIRGLQPGRPRYVNVDQSFVTDGPRRKARKVKPNKNAVYKSTDDDDVVIQNDSPLEIIVVEAT